jgi:uncharacterized membrane protein
VKQAGWLAPVWALALLAGCHSGEQATEAGLPGDTEDTTPYSGIAEDAVIRFTGTEPFWGGSVTGDRLTWSTPEIEGEQIAVTRFAGRGGLTFSGTLAGQQFDMALTPGECSDGMSDRTYPFNATVKLGAEQLSGCAWRESDDLGDAP